MRWTSEELRLALSDVNTSDTFSIQTYVLLYKKLIVQMFSSRVSNSGVQGEEIVALNMSHDAITIATSLYLHQSV